MTRNSGFPVRRDTYVSLRIQRHLACSNKMSNEEKKFVYDEEV